LNCELYYLSEKGNLRTIIILLIPGILLFVQSCGDKNNRKSFTNVVEYNDFIIDQVNEVDRQYADALNNSQDRAEGLSACDSLLALTDRALQRLENIQAFREDSTFCDAAKGFITYMKSISTRELPQFFDLIFNSNRSQEDQSEIDSRADYLDRRYEAEMAHLNLVQKALSTKFDFQINQ